MTLCVLEEGGYFVIQYLEMDIAAQGRTLDAALSSFSKIINDYKLLRQKYGEDSTTKNIPEAPSYYWDQVGVKQEGVDL